MNWIDDTLKRFGADIGINELGLSEMPDGRFGLVLDIDDGTRSICFEKQDDDLLVYLTRELSHMDDIDLTDALSVGHFRNNRTAGVQAALRGEKTLVFLTRIPSVQVSQTNLEQSLEILQSAHDALDGR